MQILLAQTACVSECVSYCAGPLGLFLDVGPGSILLQPGSVTLGK